MQQIPSFDMEEDDKVQFPIPLFSSNTAHQGRSQKLGTCIHSSRNKPPLYHNQASESTHSFLKNQSNHYVDAYEQSQLDPDSNQIFVGIKQARKLPRPPTLLPDVEPGLNRTDKQHNDPYLSEAKQHPYQSLARLPRNVQPSPKYSGDGMSSPPAQVSSPAYEASQRRVDQGLCRRNISTSQASRFQSKPLLPNNAPRSGPRYNNSHRPPPVIQGIGLISLNQLPDRFRSLFSFPLFNAIQSKCYDTAYMSNDNLVVSAPTGGGKTAILEMAICRLVSNSEMNQYKIVYMAPTKSLCAERQRDWQLRFAFLDLQCAELTGDTDQTQLRYVQNAHIIITTPEKWDSMTRKWKDHVKLFQLVKLFLIDEVHILKDVRGATLEAVVSRMKSVACNVRFIALSATVPNSEDIATWLGRNHDSQHLPARRETFGEEFRPVKLQKFVYGLPYKGNDFGFENVCNPKLPELIARHSQKKPLMIFCMTRKSTVATAKLLANVWITENPRDRQWPRPSERIVAQDSDLKNILSSGVAFHHAGLDSSDRQLVEKGFLDGQIHVICCTSTLAVGINLPCHLVIIKNTVSFQDEGLKEYADLEIMQMLGRAGRPQFDDNAVAIIITREEKANKYEKMASGEEVLESCLHLNLIDHLNAEIGLGTVYDTQSAKRWLAGTFLFVRLEKNPNHYKIDGDAVEQKLDDRIGRICQRDINLLQATDLVSSNGKLRSTEFGDAMARYYIRFETMQGFLMLGSRSKMSDILSVIVGAEELHEIRLRGGEKRLYKEINKANGIKFPIKVDIALASHKRSLILQAELGGVDFPGDEQYIKLKKQYLQDKGIIFAHIHRLVRCIIDCQIYLQDGVAVRHALELLRSFSARVWDSSPYQMKQLTQIGPVAVRKLILGGINSIEALEATEPHRIEFLMCKNPPFGMKLLENLKDFPKLRVSVKMMGKVCEREQPVKIKLKIECGFLNEKTPTYFSRRQIFICLLVERSDGLLLDFRRMNSRKVSNEEDVLMTADLLHHSQYITCYVMCDEIAGTLQYAELRPNLPPSIFPAAKSINQEQKPEQPPSSSNMLQRTSKASTCLRESQLPLRVNNRQNEEFSDGEINDQDLVDAGKANISGFKADADNSANEINFYHVENFDRDTMSQSHPFESPSIKDKQQTIKNDSAWNPKKLRNGKWACNHRCKEKTTYDPYMNYYAEADLRSRCKHLCCREGVEKAPKPPKLSNTCMHSPAYSGTKDLDLEPQPTSKNPKLQIAKDSNPTQKIDLSKCRNTDEYAKTGPRDYRKLHQLHNSVNKKPPVPTIAKSKSSFFHSKGEHPNIPFLYPEVEGLQPTDKISSDYDDEWMDDLPSLSAVLSKQRESSELPSSKEAHQNSDLALERNDSDYEDCFTLSDIIDFNRNSMAQPDYQEAQSRNAKGKEYDEEVLPVSMQSANLFQNESPKPIVKSDEGLFCSTDSPEKFVPSISTQAEMLSPRNLRVVEKRVSNAPLEHDLSPENLHFPKRPKTSKQSPNTTATSFEPQPNSEGAAAQNSERQRPAWVDEFDPEFIAEYADIVEFI